MTEKLSKVIQLLKEKEFVYDVKFTRGGFSTIDNDEVYEVAVERIRTKPRKGYKGLPFCSYIVMPVTVVDSREAEELVNDILMIIDQEDS